MIRIDRGPDVIGRSGTESIALLALFAVATAPMAAVAQTAAPVHLDPIRVEGSVPSVGMQTDLSPSTEAQPASTTVLTSEDIEKKPVGRYIDLFRNIPGIVVSDYGQGGIGVGISARGYGSSNHGNAMAFVVDGVPVNAMSGFHTQNYVEMNSLMPETIDRIEVTRGPFNVEVGEANLAGSAIVVTKNSMAPRVSGQYGNFDTARLFGGYSHNFAQEDTNASTGLQSLVAGELYTTEGYRDNQDFQRYNFMGKLSQNVGGGTLSGKLQAYAGDWGASGYTFKSRIDSGLISDRDALSLTDGGQTNQQTAALNYTPRDPGNGLTLTGYFAHADFTRYQTNTATLQQTAVQEKRVTYGGTAKQTVTVDADGLPTQFMAGVNLRGDVVEGTRGLTVQRALQSYTTNLDFTEHNLGAFAQVQVKPWDWMKLTGGGRYDHFFYDVDNHLNTAQSPSVDSGIWSPKLGIAVAPDPNVEIFANYGEGFRSPNATNELLTNRSLEPQKVQSYEIGLKAGGLPLDTVFETSLWQTRQLSEIITVFGVQQNLGESERNGFDIGIRTPILRDDNQALTFIANTSIVDAELLNRGLSRYVPGVPSHITNVGVEGQIRLPQGNKLGAQMFVQFVGSQYVNETGTVQAEPYETVTGKITYEIDEGWTTFAWAKWYPGERFSEISTASNNELATSAQPRLTMLVGLEKQF